MRLTKKYDNEYESNESEYNIWQKLGQLEDIEDELGIDLITLFKAVYNQCYYKLPSGSIYLVISKGIDIFNKIIYFEYPITDENMSLDTLHAYFKDYGKTWALTEEELE